MSPPLPVNVTESPEHITLSMSELLKIIVGIIFTLVKIIELESEQPLPAVPITWTWLVPALKVGFIKEEFEAQYEEAKLVVEWQDEDIKEGYGHFDAKMRKTFLQVFEKINTACDTIIETKKSSRKARKPRARSKESIIKKLKF